MYELGGGAIAKINYDYTEAMQLKWLRLDWLNILSPIATILFGIAAILIWSIMRIPALIKLAVGCLAMWGAYMLFLQIPEILEEGSLPVLVGSSLLIGYAEIGIVPVIYGLVTKYGNPLYFGLIFGGLAFGNKLISIIVKKVSEWIYESPDVSFRIGAIVMGFVTISLITIYFISRTQSSPKQI